MITQFLRPFGKRGENYALIFVFEIELCLFANADGQARTFRRSEVICRRILWNLQQNPNFPISQIGSYLSHELIFSYDPYNLTDEFPCGVNIFYNLHTWRNQPHNFVVLARCGGH